MSSSEATSGGNAMNGSFLRFYVLEKQHIHHLPVWEWLLQRANKLGIRGGSAFRAIAGFGRHHTMREAHFIELAGLQPIEVEFIVTEDEARKLLDLVRGEGIRVFYAQIPAHFGIINPDVKDPPEMPEQT
jgi:PII-like signaling protein